MSDIPEEEYDIAAILAMYVYLDEQDIDYDDTNIKSVLGQMRKKDSSFMDNDYYRMVDSAVREAERRSVKTGEAENGLESMELVSQSIIDNGYTSAHSDKVLIACTFRSSNGDYYVVYRGTGDGKWVDNGYAMSNESSQMQRESAAYFDEVYENIIANDPNCGNIYVTGHSKGGNEAMYVTLFAEHRDAIDYCLALDGQGFSKQAVEYLNNTYDAAYLQELCEKIYNVCGENDYVDPLGQQLVNSDHVILIQTDATDIVGYHDIAETIDGTGLKWVTDANGDIVSAEEGPFHAFSEALSEKLDGLSEERYEDCCLTIMSLLEIVMGEEYIVGTGDVRFMTYEEWIGFLVHGLPVLAETLIGTEEGRALFKEYITAGAEAFYERYGIVGVVGFSYYFYLGILTGVIPGVAVTAAVTAVIFWLPALYIDTIFEYLDKINVIAEDVKILLQKMYDSASTFYNNLLNNVTSVTANVMNLPSYIQVDTYKLRDYADRLNKVKQRLSALDRRMERLYAQEKWSDLGQLLLEDPIGEVNSRITKCVNYLTETASDFEGIEETIISALG